jgi:hypothetical protein
VVHISDGAVLTNDEEPPNILLEGVLLKSGVELSEVFSSLAVPFTAVPLIFDWGAG